QRRRYRQPKSFRRFEIYDQLNFRCLLHGKVGWLLSLENSASVRARKAVSLGYARPITHKATGRGHIAIREDGWHRMLERHLSKLLTPAIEELAAANQKPACS